MNLYKPVEVEATRHFSARNEKGASLIYGFCGLNERRSNGMYDSLARVTLIF